MLILSAPLRGQDRTPFDVYIIVDSSSAMEKGKKEAVSWLSTNVIDGILITGDRLWIWTAGLRPELLYGDAVSAGTREEAKRLIGQIRFSDGAADYKDALLEARTRILAAPGRLAYTVVVSGASPKDPPLKDAEAAGLLRFSRVQSFSGWRAITVGLDIEARAKRSAALYVKNR